MLNFLKYKNETDKQIARFVKNVFGFRPKNIQPYHLALIHKSSGVKFNGIILSNERLEYLGDAVLSLAVGDFLFRKYPTKQEGFLTEMRANIVSRASLNKISMKIGLDKQIVHANNTSTFGSMPGNAFEAFCGALFLDKGFDFSKNIIINKIIKLHVDIDEIETNGKNFKSRIIEHCQKNHLNLEFKVLEKKIDHKKQVYKIGLFINDKNYATAVDFSIKGAEQLASEKTYNILYKDNKEFNDETEASA